MLIPVPALGTRGGIVVCPMRAARGKTDVPVCYWCTYAILQATTGKCGVDAAGGRLGQQGQFLVSTWFLERDQCHTVTVVVFCTLSEKRRPLRTEWDVASGVRTKYISSGCSRKRGQVFGRARSRGRGRQLDGFLLKRRNFLTYGFSPQDFSEAFLPPFDL